MILTVPNVISLLRIPLALVFLQANPYYRALAIVLAMVSDGLDGYFARRFQQSSRLGAVLDPITDKFFVAFVLGTFIFEGKLAPWQTMTFLSRDFAIVLFGFYLTLRGTLISYQVRAIWFGKITTTLQFVVLLALTFQFAIPAYFFALFIALGVMALGELYTSPLRPRP